eukprot:m.1077 g.1077  ORF g.1077 m.1077 type:complete len:54 (-) comp1067_c0_seq1:53-214(-)
MYITRIGISSSRSNCDGGIVDIWQMDAALKTRVAGQSQVNTNTVSVTGTKQSS